MKTKALAVDLETAASLFDPGKNDALNPFRSRIAVVSWQLEGGEAKLEYTLNHEGVPHSVLQLAKVWRSPDYTLVGTNIMFDMVQLYWHYPKLFEPTVRQCRVCSVDLLVRCILGDYRDKPDKLISGSGALGNYQNGREYLCSSYGLLNLSRAFTKLKLDKTLQKGSWDTPLTAEEIKYCKLDVEAPMQIYQTFQDIASGRDLHWEIDSSEMKIVRQRLIDKNPEWIARYQLECAAWDRAFIMNTQTYLIDEPYYRELRLQIAEIKATWLLQYQQLETELKYTQKVKLAAKYNLPSINKEAYMELEDDDPRKPMLKCVIALSAIATAEKQAESLRGYFDEPVNWCNWNGCSGTGRSVSSNKGLPFPNLQAIKTRLSPIDSSVNFNLRKLIIPPTGKVFFNLDMPTAHLRAAFFVCDCKRGIEMLRDGTDIHSYIAYQIYNKCEQKQEDYHSFKALTKTDKLAKNYRGWAKNTIFAWLNGAGVDRIKAQIETNSLQPIPREVVVGLRDTINDLFWEVPAWIQRMNAWLNMSVTVIPKQNGEVAFFHTLLNCPLLSKVPVSFRPYLSYAGFTSGVRYTEPPASTWANIEVAIKKRLLSKVRHKVVVDHYDGYTFELDESTWQEDAMELITQLKDEMTALYGEDYPHGIDADYIAETLVAYQHWA